MMEVAILQHNTIHYNIDITSTEEEADAKNDVIDAILSALRRHRHVADVNRYGTKALENLAVRSGQYVNTCTHKYIYTYTHRGEPARNRG